MRMRRPATLPVLLITAACGMPPAEPAAGPAPTLAPSELMRLHERHRVGAIEEREVRHRELWDALDPLLEQAEGLVVEEVGRSAEGRALRTVTWGDGPTTVLLWSQMHGDESTATMSLADVVHFLTHDPAHPLARRLAEELTVVMLPMLNPDGAERFQRHNAFGIDVNRDARMLSTPEGRTLRELQRRLEPDFGFNLHDQNVRTRVGSTDRGAAIALLAPAFDESRSYDEVRSRARQVAAVVRGSVEPFVEGHVTRYDDAFNPRAFGDLMQAWGTSTVLIESGGWEDDPEKQYLRAVNFVGILSALDAIATGAWAAADPERYESLPRNGRSVEDLLVHGGWLVVPGLEPIRADLSVDFDEPLELRDGRITEVGDLGGVDARDTLDVEGLYLHFEPEALGEMRGAPAVTRGGFASFTVRRGPEPASEQVLVVDRGRRVRH